ncbi:MAG: TIGR02186 family protein, partial [Notoacmeibacter sp.]
IVVLEGPPKPITIREKKRILGMWINADAFAFRDVPRSYVLASTRNLRDVSPEETFRQLSLGVEMRFFEPEAENPAPSRLAYFSTALRTQKIASGLYREGIGDVRFLSQSLFKASLLLPADVPLGTHRARAFLFKNGVFIDEDSTGLYVAKDSFEQWLFNSAQQYGFFYGLAAVALAIFVGWAGRLLFRRD